MNKKFDGTLLPSEIKKVQNKAKQITNIKDFEVIGYQTNGKEDEYGFITVHCDLFSESHQKESAADIEIYVNDRRKSYVSIYDGIFITIDL